MTRRTVAVLGGIGVAVAVAAGGLALTHFDNSAVARSSGAPSIAGNTAKTSSDVAEQRAGLGNKIRGLMTNEAFRDDAAALREEYEAAKDAWWDKYGDDPESEAARDALEQLHDDQRAAMTALLEKYGVDASNMEARQQAHDETRDKLQELMATDAFRKQINAVRDKYEKAIDAWWDKYADSPRSDAARDAKEELRDDLQADVEKLLTDNGVELDNLPIRGLLGSLIGHGGMMLGGNGVGGHHGDKMGNGGHDADGSSPAANSTSGATQTL